MHLVDPVEVHAKIVRFLSASMHLTDPASCTSNSLSLGRKKVDFDSMIVVCSTPELATPLPVPGFNLPRSLVGHL
jgi:hypothetical protein